MNFSYSDEQNMLLDSVQKFTQTQYNFDTRKAILEQEHGYSLDNWKLFAELGWLMMPFTEADGGLGGSAVDTMLIMETFGTAIVVEPFVATAVLGGGLISEFANDDLKNTLLPDLMEGKLQLASAIMELDSRYNLSNVSTTAILDGDNYLLNGSKIFVINAQAADKLLVVARTSGDQIDEAGISLFLVDPKLSGITINSYQTIDGHQAATVNFENVRLPSSSLLGDEGSAHKGLVRIHNKATLAICSEAVGILDTLLSKTLDYTKTRKQFGTTISNFQALQHRMAEMFIECQLARSILTRAAMLADSNKDETEKNLAVSAAKSRIGKAMRKVGQEAIQLHGGIAMTNELDVGHYFKRLTAIEHMFGTTDHHLKLYAEQYKTTS